MIEKNLSKTTKNPILKIGLFELSLFALYIQASGLP